MLATMGAAGTSISTLGTRLVITRSNQTSASNHTLNLIYYYYDYKPLVPANLNAVISVMLPP